MYIKSIVLDGFKSYGTRTDISGFDREFNAITGLNGSGKSNILDAICFLLGLTNLNQVRAVLLQDLVYKQGQTGVSKASVTITFDNRNKEQSPVGYEACDEFTVTRQVILGGKNKYLVNGVNAPNNRVKDLFCSVQLNVNNPHFLVMQGRITKVLNMKPMEILSMIEEAAGTSMFETKKQQAEKTLERKDAKLVEIDSIIGEDIKPKLDKLKNDREQYLQFKQVERELEHVQRINIAWRYKSNKDRAEASKNEAESAIKAIEEKQKDIEKGQQHIEEITAQVAELQKQKDGESGGQLSEVEGDLREKEKQLTKMIGAQKQNVESVNDEKKRIKELEKNIRDDESVLKTKSSELGKIDGVFQRLADEEQKDKVDLEKAQKKFQALSSGLVADDSGEEGTLQDKLMEAERKRTQAQTEIEQCKRQRVHCESDLKKKTAEMQKTSSDAEKDRGLMQRLEGEVAALSQQLNSLGFDEEHVSSLRQEEMKLKSETRKLREQRDAVESRDGRLAFRYADPAPNFNRKSVHGLVCKLIDVPNPDFVCAIEKTAGARLFNVVVDTDVTSKMLLSHGKLERRTTIIPLNKISGRRLDARTIAAAQKLVGPSNVWPALDLIQFDPVIAPAMDYIFGSTLVCRDLSIAKKVCYNPDIRTKCVTLDGDTCDPSGTLSGGARQQTHSVLNMLREIKGVLKEFDAKESRLLEIQRELQGNAQKAERYTAVKQKLDLQQHELLMLKQRLQQTTHFQYQEEVNRLKEQLKELKEKEEACQMIIGKETQNIKAIQDEMKNSKANRESQLKNAENEVKRLKKKAQQSRMDREKRTEEYDSLKLEVDDLKKSIEANREQIERHKEKIENLEQAAVELAERIAEGKEVVATTQGIVKGLKETINKKNKEIALAMQKKEKIVKESRDTELEIKQLQQNRDKLLTESRECKTRVADLLKQHDWITQEEPFFGQPNGLYDFKAIDAQDTARKVASLKEMREKLGRNINSKAMNLLAKTEEQYNDLIKKRKQVENDKMKILEVIKDLGEKKKDAVKRACVQVNKDFGSIFSTLLPGAVAKLESADGKSVLSGLEFKVGFGGKWKESLGELSGGQRSLVALSLILAMLLFKPAPIYILDEVDAALDLSHTQNIGNMLKTHFKTSQFIIVSLKDGMFNNANVLFRTKFIDGMSMVERTEQRR